MIPLFSKESLRVLESLSFTDTLYAFDFDGTLAKIVCVPTDARLSKVTEKLLRQLAARVPVAIVSGRSIQDLKSRMEFKPQYLVGNHGLEGSNPDRDSMDSAERTCQKWIRALSQFNWPSGVDIEDKRYSLALHYRRARSRALARRQLTAAIDKLQPSPRMLPGKLVYNLLPIGAPHKGAAILDLVKKSGMKHVLYIGDDDTDEDVFSLPAGSGQIVSVRVGKKKSSRAAYFIPRQAEINRLLRYLIFFHMSPQVERIVGARP